MMKVNFTLLVGFLLIVSCNSNSKDKKDESKKYNNLNTVSKISSNDSKNANINIEFSNIEVLPVKLSHNINTSANEYYPTISPDGNTLFFTGMDRTGFFDTKVDFTKTRNMGGEDVFFSSKINGIWSDAKIFKLLNTNAHEAVTFYHPNSDLIVTGNYPENIGPKNTNNGSATTDLFIAVKKNDYALYHFEEPVNSIFCESDGFLSEDGNTLLFVSDRPGHLGGYHKKGWQWNESYWGNTDIYVSFKEGDSWSVPKNLGNKMNTEFTERTPWLSKDGLTLTLSSNGYVQDKKDLDIYTFKRTNKNDWDNWLGPIETKGLNSSLDDWGYKEDNAGNGYFSRAIKLDFVPTQRGRNGTGFVFENNFRSGYEVFGQQSGSFQAAEQTDIYIVNKSGVAITLPDILFDVNSYKLSNKFRNLANQLVDFIKINNPKAILIKGFTDSDGDEQLNLELSKNRANSIKELLINNGVSINIDIIGLGKSNPIVPNDTRENKSKNRRVEIFFKN